MRKLYCIVEAPDGHTWEQEVEWNEGESVKTALDRYKRMLGESYWICDWWIA